MNASKETYSAPTLVTYGPIADHTFLTPSGTNYKGCTENCHLDSFNENSGLAAS
jgi:hypothetical protein